MPLPAGWLNADIGAPSSPGSTSYLAGVWTIAGFGNGVTNFADSMQFAFTPIYGDCSITARMTSVSGAFCNGGLMVRSDLTPAAQTYLFYAGGPSFGQVNVGAQDRTQEGAAAHTFPVGLRVNTVQWYRLVLAGSTFTAFYSADGVNWTALSSVTAAIAFGTPQIWVGLCALGGGTVTFDNLNVSGNSQSPGATDPKIILRVSNDGGFTWGNERPASMGKLGDYKKLVRWRRLGRSQNRCFQVICSEPVFVALIEADLDTIA